MIILSDGVKQSLSQAGLDPSLLTNCSEEDYKSLQNAVKPYAKKVLNTLLTPQKTEQKKLCWNRDFTHIFYAIIAAAFVKTQPQNDNKTTIQWWKEITDQEPLIEMVASTITPILLKHLTPFVSPSVVNDIKKFPLTGVVHFVTFGVTAAIEAYDNYKLSTQYTHQLNDEALKKDGYKEVADSVLKTVSEFLTTQYPGKQFPPIQNQPKPLSQQEKKPQQQPQKLTPTHKDSLLTGGQRTNYGTSTSLRGGSYISIN